MMQPLTKGMRVATRRQFHAKDKVYPVGARGVVWDVFASGKVVVCLDDESCQKCPVSGPAMDFSALPYLSAGEKIMCMPMVVELADKSQVTVERGTLGVVSSHSPSTGFYSVEIPSRSVRVNVPCWRLQPVPRTRTRGPLSSGSDLSDDSSDPVTNLRKRPGRSSLSKGMRRKMSYTVSFFDGKSVFISPKAIPAVCSRPHLPMYLMV